MTAVWRRVHSMLGDVPLWAQDAALAAALTAFTQWEISQAPFVEGPLWVQRLTFAVMTVSVAGRRFAPFWSALVGSAGLSAQTIWGGDAAVVGGFLAGIIITHSVALYSTRLVAVAGLVVVLIGVHTYTFVNLDEFRLADEIGNAAVFVVIWGLGRAVRSRQRRSEIAEAYAARVEAERDAQTRAAIADERARIARELHDVVAHGVSVMVLQAGAARQVLDRDAARARQPLLAVEDSGRQALEDMHRLLGILRRDNDGLALAPIVGLAQVDELAAQMREVGLRVTVAVKGEARPLPPSLELSAYRIIQEALTNTLKHAGAATATVAVRYLPAAIDIEVADNGAGHGPSGWSGGHGLVGMRERVALFGGHLTAGPRDDGPGWVLHATLPTEGPPT